MTLSRFQLNFARMRAKILPLKTLKLANDLFENVDEGTYVETPLFGLKMPVNVKRSSTHRMLALVGENIIPEAELIKALIIPGKSVIDVGANIGYYTALFQKYLKPETRIICLEPEPQNLVELRNFVEQNALKQVEIHAVGAGDQPGKIYLSRGVNGRIQETANTSKENEQLEVPIILVDQFVDVHPGLVKIDVEGFEGQVLHGMKKIMEQEKPNIFVEVHPELLNYGYSVENIFQLCSQYYQKITCWQQQTTANPVQKLLGRYYPQLTIKKLPGLEQIVAECQKKTLTEPFWMICHQS